MTVLKGSRCTTTDGKRYSRHFAVDLMHIGASRGRGYVMCETWLFLFSHCYTYFVTEPAAGMYDRTVQNFEPYSGSHLQALK